MVFDVVGFGFWRCLVRFLTLAGFFCVTWSIFLCRLVWFLRLSGLVWFLTLSGLVFDVVWFGF